MRIATWNINSIRARLDRVIAWLEHNNIDIAALQETKCSDAQFPYESFRAAGYHAEHYGFNQWNGVAIISKEAPDDQAYGFANEPGFVNAAHKSSATGTNAREGRALGVTYQGVRLWSIYVPNGRQLTDPHYEYKIHWLTQFRTHIHSEIEHYPYMILTGDWNIAPYDHDVWDITQFEGKTHVSTLERAKFFDFIDMGFSDPIRQLFPDSFTYWDYTSLRFPKNQGMRIDFALLSSQLAPYFLDGKIDREQRKGKGASDHAPIIIDIKDR